MFVVKGEFIQVRSWFTNNKSMNFSKVTHVSMTVFDIRRQKAIHSHCMAPEKWHSLEIVESRTETGCKWKWLSHHEYLSEYR